MSEDYYEYAELNPGVVFLFGRRIGGEEFSRRLTDDEREKLGAFADRQREEMYRFLRGLADHD